VTCHNFRITSKIRNSYALGPRIYFSIHRRRPYRHHTIKRVSRCYTTRHLLRSSSLPLRPQYRSSVCNLRRIYPLIPLIFRCHPTSALGKGTVLPNVYWGQPDFFPPALPRTKRYATPILRLPRRLHKMTRHFINRIGYFFRSPTVFYLHYLRGLYCPTRRNLEIPPTHCNGVTRPLATRLPQPPRGPIPNPT